MTKNRILKLLQNYITDFMIELPENLKKNLGGTFFYFDFEGRAFNNGAETLATYEAGMNSITFYLDGIRRTSRTPKDLKIIIKHEIGHHFGIPEERLPQQK